MNSWNNSDNTVNNTGESPESGNMRIPDFSGEQQSFARPRLLGKGSILALILSAVLSLVIGFAAMIGLDYFGFQPLYAASFFVPYGYSYNGKTPGEYPNIGSVPGPGGSGNSDEKDPDVAPREGGKTLPELRDPEPDTASENLMTETSLPDYPVKDAPRVKRHSAKNLDKLSVNEIADRLLPCVASIVAYTSEKDTDSYFLGTGTVYSSDGYIITNCHVIEGCIRAEVILFDGSTYQARCIASDAQADIAILKIDAAGLTPVTFGISNELLIGDTVAAIGNPASLELSGTTTVGRISGPERYITIDSSGNIMRLLQTDASVNPGNSGGPLVNEYGQVIGIITAKMTADTFEGIGFAIASDRLEKIVSDLLDYGFVTGYPMLGITGSTVYENEYDGKNPEGVLVAEVSVGSDANGKVMPGDIIHTCNSQTVGSIYEINIIKAHLEVGDTMTLGVYRNGEEIEVTITLKDKHSID